MKSTYFFKENGNLSSVKHTMNVGNTSISFSQSSNGTNKHSTYKTPYSTTRIGKNRKVIDFGTTGSGQASYFHAKSFSNKIRNY